MNHETSSSLLVRLDIASHAFHIGGEVTIVSASRPKYGCSCVVRMSRLSACTFGVRSVEALQPCLTSSPFLPYPRLTQNQIAPALWGVPIVPSLR